MVRGLSERQLQEEAVAVAGVSVPDLAPLARLCNHSVAATAIDIPFFVSPFSFTMTQPGLILKTAWNI